MHAVRALCLAAAVLALPSGAAAQDLIVNGHFHDDINGWTLVGVGTQAWDPLDWQGDPTSGSVRVTNTDPVANGGTASAQCILLTPSGTYEAGAHVRFPSGQVMLGVGAVGIGWFANTTCTNPPISTVNTPGVFSTTTNVWTESFMSGLAAPPGTVAVGVAAGVAKLNAGGSLAGLFDRVRFGPTGTTPVRVQDFSVEEGRGRLSDRRSPGLRRSDPRGSGCPPAGDGRSRRRRCPHGRRRRPRRSRGSAGGRRG